MLNDVNMMRMEFFNVLTILVTTQHS